MIAVAIFLVGCATPSVSHRDIVLVDSEIPWQMTPGQYIATDGSVYIVEESFPRWSVSEAWMFNSFAGIDYNKDDFFDKICVRTVHVIFLAVSIILLLIIRFAAWTYK